LSSPSKHKIGLAPSTGPGVRHDIDIWGESAVQARFSRSNRSTTALRSKPYGSSKFEASTFNDHTSSPMLSVTSRPSSAHITDVFFSAQDRQEYPEKIYLLMTPTGWSVPSSYSSKNFSGHFLERNWFTAFSQTSTRRSIAIDCDTRDQMMFALQSGTASMKSSSWVKNSSSSCLSRMNMSRS
jgi:hypothetical protein